MVLSRLAVSNFNSRIKVATSSEFTSKTIASMCLTKSWYFWWLASLKGHEQLLRQGFGGAINRRTVERTIRLRGGLLVIPELKKLFRTRCVTYRSEVWA